MILAFWTVVILLLVAGTLRTRFQQATLHWGRTIAGLGHVEHEITQAKGSDAAHAAELLGRSAHQRGFQDAITPPRQTSLTISYWILCVAIYAWGFFVLPWYLAIAWPVLFVIGNRIFGSVLPAPDAEIYRQKIIASLEARCNRFRRAGDEVRLQAAEHMIMLLRVSDPKV